MAELAGHHFLTTFPDPSQVMPRSLQTVPERCRVRVAPCTKLDWDIVSAHPGRDRRTALPLLRVQGVAIPAATSTQRLDRVALMNEFTVEHAV